MAVEASDGDQNEPAPIMDPAREQTTQPREIGRSDQSPDTLGRLFGRGGNRNGLTKTERLVAWMLLSALVGVGAFASLAIPYLIEALHRR